jgi:hypothetical protein
MTPTHWARERSPRVALLRSRLSSSRSSSRITTSGAGLAGEQPRSAVLTVAVVLLVVVAAQRQPGLGPWWRLRHRPAVGLADVVGALPVGPPGVAEVVLGLAVAPCSCWSRSRSAGGSPGSRRPAAGSWSPGRAAPRQPAARPPRPPGRTRRAGRPAAGGRPATQRTLTPAHQGCRRAARRSATTSRSERRRPSPGPGWPAGGSSL